MKRLMSALLLIVLACTSASALIGCKTTTYTITYHVDGTVPEGFLDNAEPTTYKLSREDTNLWWPSVDESKYTFYAWYDNENFSGMRIGFLPAATSGNLDFYGLIIENAGYDITYVINGEVQEDRNDTYTFSNNSKTLWQPVSDDEEYYFSGWTETEDEEATTVAMIPSNSFGDKTFYGEFIKGEPPASYTVSFVFEGEPVANPSMTSYTYSKNRATQITYLPTIQNPEEYGFKGWYLNSDFTGKAYFQIPADTTGNLTFYGRYSEPDGYATQTGRKLASNFALYEYGADVIDANKITLNTNYGKKPLFLNFWSSECGPCKEEMPAIQEIYNARKNEIEFLMINALAVGSDTEAKSAKYMTDNDFTFPWILDDGRGAANGNTATFTIYKIQYFPTTMIIDRWGYIVSSDTRPLSKAEFNSRIDEAFRY